MGTNSTLYIKNKWEKELNVLITDEEWKDICMTQCTSTNSKQWREFNWKNVVRFFITPKIKGGFEGTQQPCWRGCGQMDVGHGHIFWDCRKLADFWQTIWQLIKKIIGYGIPRTCTTLYLGQLGPDITQREDEFLIKIFLTASRKTITRLWYKTDPPTKEQWMSTVDELLFMEKLTHKLRLQEPSFKKKCHKWTDFKDTEKNNFTGTASH